MKDFQRMLYEAVTTPEERARHAAEQEEKARRRVRKRLYADLARKGVTAEEVDERGRRLREVMSRGNK